MNQTISAKERFMKISVTTSKTLENLINKLKHLIKGKRDLMYSDIINLIIRGGYVGENYNEIILWCNYKIRLGKTFIEFE